MNTPDHYTINRFRGNQLLLPLNKLFFEVVKSLNVGVLFYTLL